MNLFGKKKQAVAPNPAEAIMKLRGTMETLEKREQFIQKKMEAMVQEAKQKMSRKDKNGALFALKKKKMYEVEVTKIQGARMNLESQCMSLEGSATNMEVFGAMRVGAKAMGAMRKDLDVDKVDDLIDDIREEMDTASHISEAISTPLDSSMQSDEDLLAELDALVQEDETTKLTEAPTLPTRVTAPQAPAPAVPDLPAVPTRPLPQPAVADADDEELKALRELESSMAV